MVIISFAFLNYHRPRREKGLWGATPLNSGMFSLVKFGLERPPVFGGEVTYVVGDLFIAPAAAQHPFLFLPPHYLRVGCQSGAGKNKRESLWGLVCYKQVTPNGVCPDEEKQW